MLHLGLAETANRAFTVPYTGVRWSRAEYFFFLLMCFWKSHCDAIRFLAMPCNVIFGCESRFCCCEIDSMIVCFFCTDPCQKRRQRWELVEFCGDWSSVRSCSLVTHPTHDEECMKRRISNTCRKTFDSCQMAEWPRTQSSTWCGINNVTSGPPLEGLGAVFPNPRHPITANLVLCRSRFMNPYSSSNI